MTQLNFLEKHKQFLTITYLSSTFIIVSYNESIIQTLVFKQSNAFENKGRQGHAKNSGYNLLILAINIYFRLNCWTSRNSTKHSSEIINISCHLSNKEYDERFINYLLITRLTSIGCFMHMQQKFKWVYIPRGIDSIGDIIPFYIPKIIMNLFAMTELERDTCYTPLFTVVDAALC